MKFFCEFAPKNSAKFDSFSMTYQKPFIAWRDPSDLKISWIMDRSRYKLGGKLALFMRFGTFFMIKAKQDKMKSLF